jgi:hypothetical protein
MLLNYDLLEGAYKKRSFVFLKRPYEVNVGGIRSKNPVVNEFNDVLFIAYLDGFGQKQCLCFKGSTLPGLYYLKNKLGNVKGTFIVQPGQNINAWELSFHHIGTPEQYEAYRQVGTILGWRDDNADGKFDFSGPTYSDGQGVNGHHAADKAAVGAYSAGCFVVQDKEEHLIWIAPAKRHVELYGNHINLTLFQEQ